MPAKDVFTANALNHARRNAASKSTLVFVENLLRTNSNTLLANNILDLRNKRVRREENDLCASFDT